jgi:hypothetical protein
MYYSDSVGKGPFKIIKYDKLHEQYVVQWQKDDEEYVLIPKDNKKRCNELKQTKAWRDFRNK